MTNKVADKVKAIVADNNTDIDSKMKKVEGIENKIKFSAFGKTKPSTKKWSDTGKCKQCRLPGCNPSPEAQLNKCSSCKTQDEKDGELIRRQSEKLELAINNIKARKLGRAGSVYKMKDEIVGHKKAKQEATAIRDPITNKLIVSKERIKEVTLQYVVDNLKGNEPDEEVREIVTLRREIQINKMQNKSDDSFELEEEDFDMVLDKFKRKPTKTYDFLVKAGVKYQAVIF